MTTLTSRVEGVLEKAKILDAYFEEHGVPYPSFDENALDQLPQELQGYRWAFANEANDLKKLMRGPLMTVLDTASNWTDSLPLWIVTRYQLARAVPLDGTASYAEIATKSGLSKSLVTRMIRAAIGNNIFDEDPLGRVKHTAISRLLATDPGIEAGVRLQTEEWAPAAVKLPEAWEEYGQDSEDRAETAFSLYHGPGQSRNEILAAHPARAKRFGDAMRFYTAGDAWDLRHLFSAFDWNSIDQPGTTVVDLGGSNGQVSQYLARHTKDINFVVQDLPQVISTAAGELPDDLKDRVSFKAHDFMTPQPSGDGPTVFFMRWITHEWTDRYCVRILRNLVPAMQPGSMILVYEYILVDGPTKDLSNRFGLQMDMIMLIGVNARERTAEDFERVLRESDPRFSLEGIHKPEGSAMSLVEIVWKE